MVHTTAPAALAWELNLKRRSKTKTTKNADALWAPSPIASVCVGGKRLRKVSHKTKPEA